jgi:hypothetical protein
MNLPVYLLRFDFFELFDPQLKLGILPDRFDDFNLLLAFLRFLRFLFFLLDLLLTGVIVGAEVGGTVGSHVGKPVGMTVGPAVLQLLLLLLLFFELLSCLLDFFPEGPDTNRIGGHVGASDIVGAGVLLLLLLLLFPFLPFSLRTFSCLSIILSFSPRKLRFNVLT